jgi:flagellar hook protein FlgE
MSIVRTLDTGSTGLIANDNAMSVTGNNIANTNTAGFKAGQARFEDLLYQRLTGTYFPSDLGAGVRMSGITSNFTQGTLMDTGNPLDMAIDGGGLFVVRDPALNQHFYTRAGQFGTDSEGYVINSWGQRLRGYGLDPLSGSAVGALSDVHIRNDLQTPKATSAVKMNVNLDSNTKAHVPNPGDMLNLFTQLGQAAVSGNVPALVSALQKTINRFPPDVQRRLAQDLATGNISQLSTDVIGYFSSNYSDYSTQVTVIDSQGEEHAVDVYFTKLSDSTMLGTNPASPGSTWMMWTAYNAKLPGGLQVRALGNVQCLIYDRTGQLRQQQTYLPGSYVFDDGSVNPQLINFDLGIQSPERDRQRTQVGIPLDPNLGAATTRSAPSNVNSIWQDGLRAQHFMEIDMDSNGRIFGLNPDGSTTYISQVALAEFPNQGGLERVGKNNFIESNVSGAALIGKPNTGQRGSIVIRNVEQSNVDITKEFVDMIKVQRFYQANAETIRTADQMFQVLTGLRR